MFGYYGFDSYYFILVLPAILFSLWAQSKVKGTFSRYQKVRSYSGYTGADVARRILDNKGLYNVRVEHIAGSLTDHYDPRTEVVRLSDSVYGSNSIAALGVAAHETGHAIQHSTQYAPLTIRNAIIPVTNYGSKLSVPLIFLGLLLNSSSLIGLGIICFAMVTLFQLVTLPVEFDASARAMRTLSNEGILQGDEVSQTQKVLTAAALTYVAALIVSAAQLLRLVLLFNRRRD
ncbi:MAG TPA: zinc metallopeptidase [Clostridia bacterium]|nr:zinc metallopeptidase [Clostridia bacterium]